MAWLFNILLVSKSSIKHFSCIIISLQLVWLLDKIWRNWLLNVIIKRAGIHLPTLPKICTDPFFITRVFFALGVSCAGSNVGASYGLDADTTKIGALSKWSKDVPSWLWNIKADIYQVTSAAFLVRILLVKFLKTKNPKKKLETYLSKFANYISSNDVFEYCK